MGLDGLGKISAFGPCHHPKHLLTRTFLLYYYPRGQPKEMTLQRYVQHMATEQVAIFDAVESENGQDLHI